MKATKSYFLIGYDEDDMFISSLRKPVATVAEAHEQLIPKSLKKQMAADGNSGILRQGEWFLVPATEEELASIEKNDNIEYSEGIVVDGIGTSDHHSLLSITRRFGSTFLVTGLLKNSRHFLVLNGWYRPVRNNEVPPKYGENWD